ncbi:MAG: alginate lyase family protein, partial [Paraclostridium sp.]|uniref:heparinase II/III family protein n=1 Tax=Paraclostridium sp. TaxID=2023273 RepID=UPI003F2DAEAA
KYLWLYNRLKAMPPQEVVYRIKKSSSHKINKMRFNKKIKVHEVQDINIDLNKLDNNLKKIFNKVNVDCININDNYCVFMDKIDLNNEIEWHKGIFNNWKKDISCYDVVFKNTDSIGDIRYTWEINRHQFLLYLAVAYTKTNDSKYLDLIQEHVDNWIEENGFLKGVNWSSPMEIALRAYQWVLLLFLLEGIDLKELKGKLAKSAILSIDYVMNNLSLYSSANNHLILEAAISSIVGLCFEGIYNQNWFNKGYKILNKELKKQIHGDGVNKEQALHYQGFVTDMMLQYNSIVKKVNHKPIEEDLIEKSVKFIYTLNADKQYVDFGDSDDAKIISLRSDSYNYYDYILCFASRYYNKSFSLNKFKYPEISLFLDANLNESKVEIKELSLFKDGGYSIINYDDDLLVFDFGELGFGSLAAHGHADALMLNYYRKGNPIFIDSGTYIYNIEKEKRDYYRSTKEHNTLCYNDENQSEIKGPFLWGKKSNSKLLNTIEKDKKIIIEAQNDGYSPSIHKRKIIYYKESKNIAIYDYFDKLAELNFILDDNVSIELVEDNILKLKNKEEIYVYFDGQLNIKDTMISKQFMKEIKSKKINIKYNFKKEHLVYISNDIKHIYKLISERRRI